jgi:catechol 2,3-dioxygenase-like lactoylglutathione lyase family enzyme
MRLQLALNVRNIEEAVDYYAKLFGVQPHKLRPGYANFAIEQPPLKLVLFENPDAAERINHLGVEVFAQEEPQGLRWEWYRITDDAPAEAVMAAGTTCCADANEPGKVCCS